MLAGILTQIKYTYEFFDLWIFAKYLDRLSDYRLVKIIFRVDGITPEGDSSDSDGRDGKISETSKGPMEHFQHSDIILIL